MTDELVAQLMARTFELSLPRCELRQRGSTEPRVYSGPGFIRQGADGTLTLRMFAQEDADQGEQLMRLFGVEHTPGVLIPDTSLFDLLAIDQSGDTWRADRLSIEETFGISTEIHTNFAEIEKLADLNVRAKSASRIWFIPETFKLPWHIQTRSEKGTSTDRFEFEDDAFAWKVRKVEGGRIASLTVKQAPLEPHAQHFLYALGMLSGHILEPLVSQQIENCRHTTRIDVSCSRKPARLNGPLETTINRHYDAHRFLSCCLRNSHQSHPEAVANGPVVDQLSILYRFWYRIAKAQSNDIENSSLVLSVAIEGVLKEIFHSEHDTDVVFAEALHAAKPTIEQLEINERVRDSILRSLENSALPKPKDTMQRLKEQGALHQDHIAAWNALRNKGAHGALLEDATVELQKHLNRYFRCLDLFYRLAFVALGYQGHFVDRSASKWPASQFPPPPKPSEPAAKGIGTSK